MWSHQGSRPPYWDLIQGADLLHVVSLIMCLSGLLRRIQETGGMKEDEDEEDEVEAEEEEEEERRNKEEDEG